MWYKSLSLRISSLMFCSFLIAPNIAFPITAHELFRSGIESAQNEDYQSARNEFEMAHKMGLNSAALHYNLGVSYYRLSLYEQAYASFEILLNHEKLAAVAAYNLGLTTEKLKRYEEAKQWYTRVLSMSTDPGLRDLSDKALRFLSEPVQKGGRLRRPAAVKKWQGSLSMKLANDDNLGQDVDSNEQTGNSMQVDLSTRRYLIGNRSNGLRLSGRLNSVRYIPEIYFDRNSPTIAIKKTSDFNSDFAQFITSYHRKQFSWNNRLSALISSRLIDGEQYQDSIGYELRTERYFSKLVKLRFRYRYREITTSTNFDYVAGKKKYFRIDVRLANFNQKKGRKNLRFAYIYEENHRHSQNYSPDRTWLRFSTDAPLAPSAKLKFAIEYRFTTYAAYTTTTTPTPRRDNRTRLRLELDYKPLKAWHLILGVVYTENDSDADVDSGLFIYSQNSFYTAVRWFY